MMVLYSTVKRMDGTVICYFSDHRVKSPQPYSIAPDELRTVREGDKLFEVGNDADFGVVSGVEGPHVTVNWEISAANATWEEAAGYRVYDLDWSESRKAWMIPEGHMGV